MDKKVLYSVVQPIEISKSSYQATSQRRERESEHEATFNSNHVSKEEGGVYLISSRLIDQA